jgi:hypothetical protein
VIISERTVQAQVGCGIGHGRKDPCGDHLVFAASQVAWGDGFNPYNKLRFPKSGIPVKGDKCVSYHLGVAGF